MVQMLDDAVFHGDPPEDRLLLGRPAALLCVVHADRRVVIDRRFPEQCIIRVVSAMRTKQSIGYKMISHGSSVE